MKNLLVVFFASFICISASKERPSLQSSNPGNMIVRIAEIEIEPEFLDEYLAILKEESRASVELEPGVISIFPMTQNDNPASIRILEIYQSQDAYESHLETPHFKHYKESTMKMVKSLNLVDMNMIDEEALPLIFAKTQKP